MLLATVLLTLTLGPTLISDMVYRRDQTAIALAKTQAAASPSLKALNEDFKRVSKIVQPSVVHIKTEFVDVFAPPNRSSATHTGYIRSSGSGWVFDKQGHIVTNFHVIQQKENKARKIIVKFIDGSEHPAAFIGGDPRTDIAILKVNKKNLHPAEKSQAMIQQGEFVFAFGSPYQFDFSMSQGIVSGIGRKLGILQGYENFIQTDAAINPGNSGGPLTNLQGRVVGMNTAILSNSASTSSSQSFVGLGFAIPVDTVTQVAKQLIANGKVNQGFLGIYPVMLYQQVASRFKYQGKGIFISSEPVFGSPANNAGIRKFDILTHINGESITRPTQLRQLIASIPPGQTVTVSIFRDGQRLELKATLAKYPE